MKTCRVTVFNRPGRGYDAYTQTCGAPVVRAGLCAFHLSEKERLS